LEDSAKLEFESDETAKVLLVNVTVLLWDEAMINVQIAIEEELLQILKKPANPSRRIWR